MINNNTQGVVLNSTRTRLILVGVALCAALFVFVGCPEGTPPDGDTAPVITLTGDAVIVVAIGADFTDPGIDVSNNQPAYTGTVTTAITDSAGTTISEINTAIAGIYTITYTAPADTDRNTPATITRTVRVSVDVDGDTLIDIRTIDDLNAMRHNLDGTAYQATADGTELLCGTDAATACTGYELTRALDFASGDSYASGTVNPAWRPTGGAPDTATNAGWEPIGSCNDDDSDSFSEVCGDSDDTPFAARFVGNGFTIANLYARNVEASGAGVGLFGLNGGAMEGIGIVDANIYGGDGSDFIGGLIGFNTVTGTITDSYATGDVDGGGGVNDVGGLVGVNLATITDSYATGDVDGGGGSDRIGGLVGNNRATITDSYATGNVDGGGGSDRIGGLAGVNNNANTITASYATGNVDGGDGNEDFVGGLVGFNGDFSTITASYATGGVDGGDGDEDFVGGLVGHNAFDAIITASYATGGVDGGVGGSDHVGELIGRNFATATASYGFGMAMGGEATTNVVTRSGDASDAMAVTNACALTQANSSTMTGTPDNRWDATQWDFGTTMQRPVLQDSGTIIAGQTNRTCN